MHTQPCLSSELININRKKEYTLISTELLESVLSDSRLNAQSTKLWQILFNKARYNPKLEIKISYSYLAKKLSKSTRTIARYIDTLEDAGYLVITHNFDKNGSQRPNTISVRVPENSIKQVSNKRDRVNKNYSNNNDTFLKTSSNATYSHLPQEEDTSINVIVEQTSSDKINITSSEEDRINKNVLRGSFAAYKASTSTEDGGNTGYFLASDHGLSKTGNDKNDMEGYDITVLQKNINKKEINNNNNNVVVSFCHNQSETDVAQEQDDFCTSYENRNSIETITHNSRMYPEMSELEKKIKAFELQLNEGMEQESQIQDHRLLYTQIRKNSELEGTLHLARIKLAQVKKEAERNANECGVKAAFSSDSFFIQNKKGERALSELTFKRLVKSLKSYGYHGYHLNRLINEIVFEARFGSLIRCNKSTEFLAIDKSINIGLKLVREKRWSTPSLLKM